MTFWAEAGRRRDWPRVIGHRGAAAAAPENTLAGFRRAKALGVDWVEFDIRLTRDGQVILLHDATLDRTTDGTGRAGDLTFAAIRAVDAGIRFDPAYRGERVPGLAETIDLLGELGLGAIVELKPDPGAEIATAAAALALLAERWPDHLPPPLVSSFAPGALAAARAAAPAVERALLVGAVPANWPSRLAAVGAVMLHADAGRLDRATVGRLADAEVPLFAYTVNRPDQARTLWDWGVQAVFSDVPDKLVAMAAGGV